MAKSQQYKTKKKTNFVILAAIIVFAVVIVTVLAVAFQEGWLSSLGEAFKFIKPKQSVQSALVKKQADNLIKQIERLEKTINASSAMPRAVKSSYLEELDVLLFRADELKTQAEPVSRKKRKGISLDALNEIKEIKSVLESIKKRIELESYPEKVIAEDKCPENYGLRAETVVFYYTDEPHSNAMQLIVSQLKSEGYSFYSTDDLWNSKASKCLDVIGTTPTFICAGTNEKLVGEVSKEELEAFADRCISSI